jgi:hypothetical protein
MKLLSCFVALGLSEQGLSQRTRPNNGFGGRLGGFFEQGGPRGWFGNNVLVPRGLLKG